ncbi:MAG: hypothetical protein AAB455_02990 [Patescibacteria group bacterium]
MENTMTPSKPMTEGQIGKINENLRAALNKAGLQSEPAQKVITTKSQCNLMIDEMVAVVRKFVEALSNLIIRRVHVDRTRTPQAAIKATGRTPYINHEVVNTMPMGEGEEAELVFFKPDLSDRGGQISDDDLEKEYELRDLIPADPNTVCAFNESDPAFADEKPHGTHWKNAEGKWCYATFYRWLDDERYVNVYRNDVDWRDRWSFAGVRKSSVLVPKT